MTHRAWIDRQHLPILAGSLVSQMTETNPNSERHSVSDDERFVYWLFQPHRLAVLALLLTVPVFLPHWLQRLPDLSREPEYQVSFQSTTLHPSPPQWVPANFLEQVRKSGKLPEQLPILNSRLLKEVNDAFAAHPWVAKVVSVKKEFPARIEVSLEYRCPVAMVQVPQGLYPVDVHGVLLPPADFAPATVKQFPVIRNVVSLPCGKAGQRWGDVTVHESAALAKVLQEKWTPWNLQAIVPSRRTRADISADDVSFELLTQNQSKFLWGRGPGSRYPGELTTAQKLGRLEKYQQDYGSQIASSTPCEVDLRHWREISRRPLISEVPATATKPVRNRTRQ